MGGVSKSVPHHPFPIHSPDTPSRDTFSSNQALPTPLLVLRTHGRHVSQPLIDCLRLLSTARAALPPPPPPGTMDWHEAKQTRGTERDDWAHVSPACVLETNSKRSTISPSQSSAVNHRLGGGDCATYPPCFHPSLSLDRRGHGTEVKRQMAKEGQVIGGRGSAVPLVPPAHFCTQEVRSGVCLVLWLFCRRWCRWAPGEACRERVASFHSAQAIEKRMKRGGRFSRSAGSCDGWLEAGFCSACSGWYSVLFWKGRRGRKEYSPALS